jgi:hypothetical protein
LLIPLNCIRYTVGAIVPFGNRRGERELVINGCSRSGRWLVKLIDAARV